jgi:hypothetical protein
VLLETAFSGDAKIAEGVARFQFYPEVSRGEILAVGEREIAGALVPTDGGGLRWTAEGNDGCIARVNFPAPSLKSKIDGEGKLIEKIKQLAGAVFSRLFIPTITFKPVENFRDAARALLAKTEANKLIKLCQSESAPRVSFETAERSAVTA